jgi:YesN/AraC family two-component response regulator
VVYLSGMVCDCCKRLIELLLEKDDIAFISVGMGKIVFPFIIDDKIISAFLKRNKFKQIVDKNQILVNEIKIAVVELVHYSNNNNSIIRNSDYLVEKIGRSYQQLSSIFAEYENRTLEKYIIAHKIERTKYLIIRNEMSLSEIAFQMGYSSVQYLSNQFKKITGITVSEFKKIDKPELLELDRV